MLHPLLRPRLGHDGVAVVERDRDERRRGVEGEQHGSRLLTRSGHGAPVGGQPAVVVEEVDGVAGRGVVPEERAGPPGRGRPWRPPRRRGAAGGRRRCWRPSCARARRAWPRRAGDRPSTAARSSASTRRIGSIRSMPISTGGWCRQTKLGRSSRASSASSQARVSGPSSPWSWRTPSTASTSESSIRNRDATDLVGPVGPRDVGVGEERGGVRRSDVVVARRDRHRAGPRRQHLDRLGVLVGEPVVGHVAGVQQHVGPGVHRQQRVEHAAHPVGGFGRRSEVRVAEVGDDQHVARLVTATDH